MFVERGEHYRLVYAVEELGAELAAQKLHHGAARCVGDLPVLQHPDAGGKAVDEITVMADDKVGVIVGVPGVTTLLVQGFNEVPAKDAEVTLGGSLGAPVEPDPGVAD